MIQRIQTLYLLSAGAVLAAFVGIQAQWPALLDGPYAPVGIALLLLGGVAAILAFGAVALYKNRALQRRVISWALWADLAVVAAALATLWLRSQAGEAAPDGVMFGAMGPVMAYLLLRLARAGVDRDIATVRSMDRIR